MASGTTAAAAAPTRPRFSGPSVNTSRIAVGHQVRVTAKLIDPKTGKAVHSGSVRLQALRHGTWRTWQAKKLNSAGVVQFWSEPHVTGWFRTQYTGSSAHRWAAGRAVKVTVASNGSKVLNEAKRHKGALYLFGAAGPRRFDCSGFTMYVYRKTTGKKLPHKANSQQRYGHAVSKSNKQVGDLIVFRSGSYGYHAGIYAGGGYIYDSPHSGARVGSHKMWSKNYVVRRLV
jgi:cell wall-associated NlpC family hydrolase